MIDEKASGQPFSWPGTFKETAVSDQQPET